MMMGVGAIGNTPHFGCGIVCSSQARPANKPYGLHTLAERTDAK